MKDILLALYNGEIYPSEQCVPKSEEYKKICEEYCDSCDELIKALRSLDPPLDKRFTEVIDMVPDITSFEASEMFVCGFKLGAGLMLEILTSDHYHE